MENNSSVSMIEQSQDQLNQQYQQKLQLARYSNLSEIENSECFKYLGKCKDQKSMFVIFAKFLPKEKKQLENLTLYLINLMDDKIQGGFYLVLFNTMISSYNCVQQIFNFFKSMPEKYHKNLEKMYMVDPSFWTKSYIWWNKKKIFKSKIEYIDNFKQESKSGVLENIQLYKIPQEILKNIGYNQKEIQEIKEEEAKKQKDLDQNTFEGKEFFELDKDEKDQIPIAFKRLIEFLNEDNQRLKILGIFRKSGFQKELIELENEFFKKNYEYINKEEIDPLVAGGLLKKILHKSKIPLFPFRVNEDILKLIETDRQDQINLCKQIIDKELDEQRRNILQYLMEFLIKVQSYQKQNQMSVYNLAVCFAPCLLRSEQSSMLDIKLTGGYVRLIQIIMENLNFIFGKQDQINESTEMLQQVNQQYKEENLEQGNEQNLVQNDQLKQENQNQKEQ